MNERQIIDLTERMCGLGYICSYQGTQVFVREYEKLNKPEKVKVPQLVAYWIKHCRGLGYSLYQSMELVHENAEIKKWFIFVDNQDLFARAWLDGYEVEEEKRYTVVIKETKQPLYYNAEDKKLFFSMGGLATNFTQKQLEDADFGEVFNSPLFEVVEVE